MDSTHSAVSRNPASSLENEDDGGDTRMVDIEHEIARGEHASDRVILDNNFDDIADSIEELDAIDGLKPFRDLGTSEGREIVVEVLHDTPVSPRRNAWDWSVGGLGPNMRSMDGFMDIDTYGDT
ncbi:hypothetical protein MMC34_006134 [Xylographa carneopallida]|nr:hypothetical protein [Xylographa carneopallida]